MKKTYIIILIIIAVMALVSVMLGYMSRDKTQYPDWAIKGMKEIVNNCIVNNDKADLDRSPFLIETCNKIIEYERNCNWECYDKEAYNFIKGTGFLLPPWERSKCYSEFEDVRDASINTFLGLISLLSFLTLIISPIILVVTKNKRKKIDPNSEQYKKYSKRIYILRKLIKIVAVTLMFSLLALSIMNFQISGPLCAVGVNA